MFRFDQKAKPSKSQVICRKSCCGLSVSRSYLGSDMRNRGSYGRGNFPKPVVWHLTACLLALHGSVDKQVAAQSLFSPNRDTLVLDPAENELYFEDLPEGFHNDVDSITIAMGGHHTCALEYRPGVDFGGPVRCWGRDDWSQSTPPDDIFVQVM